MKSFEEIIFDNLKSRGKQHGVRNHDGKDYIHNQAWYEYAHWVYEYLNKNITRDMLVKILSGDGLSFLFDEKDLSIELSKNNELPYQAKKLEIIDKNSVDEIKRKASATELISKYFPQAEIARGI